MLASDTLESPCLCCPSAGAEPEGTWKVKDKGSLNLSDDNFHQENDAGSTPARSSQCGRSDLGQEVEPELFDRRLLLQTGAVSCITAVRGACGTAGEAALPAQPLSLHSCCSAECPCEGLAATKISWTAVYYSISYVLTRKHLLQYSAYSSATDSRRFLTVTLWV